jgi:branched-chain amino acid transport system permease protein
MGVVGLTVMSAACCMSVWTNFDPEIGPSRLLIAFEVVVRRLSFQGRNRTELFEW